MLFEEIYDDDNGNKTLIVNFPSLVMNPHVRVRLTRDFRMPESSLHSSPGAEFADTSATMKHLTAYVNDKS
uniref:Arp2/3 complex 34 kDa subunit n=1 Tax=Panagrellus redivivus TaxID=6233 RepID=A0A7E4VQ80_PANRE